MTDMFRLLSLSILHHHVLGNIELDFFKNKDENIIPNNIYTSVVIGANGIGKSYLMRAIADIFSYLDTLCREVEIKNNPISYYFCVRYRIGIEEYEFSNFGVFNPVEKTRKQYTHLYYKRNGKKITVEQMRSPARIIASTMTVTDKFTTVNNGNYIYKGIRNEKSPSTTGTRTMIRKTVSGLLHSLDVKEGFRHELGELLEHMGLRPRLDVSYSLRYKQVFLDPEMTSEKLCHIFDHQEEFFKKRKSSLWGTANFQKLRADVSKLEKTAQFLRELAEVNVSLNNVQLNYNVLEDTQRINSDKDAIDALSSIDLLSFPSLRIYKRDINFTFDQSSSGETHMICQLIGIMSDIEHNSIVLIDEPENSAHPNWQISYIEWLKKIFKYYSDCHFVIATHSHFLLTDLVPGESDIVALERNENGLDDIDIDNAYCWSVDDILYRVFRVRNTRNYVFESKMMDLYKLMSNKGDKELVNRLKVELSHYQLNSEDPLKKLLDKAEKYVESK